MQDSFGQHLRKLRIAAGYSSPEKVEKDRQRQNKASVSGRNIRNIEEGHIDRPEAETLRVLAEVYGADYEDLIRRAGYLPEEVRGVGAPRAERVQRIAQNLEELPEDDQKVVEAVVDRLRLARSGHAASG